MTDPKEQKRSLSEISHLFLSSVREKQTGGAPRPQRIPPGQARLPDNIRLPLSDELSATRQAPIAAPAPAAAQTIAPQIAEAALPRRTPPVFAVLASHLGERQAERVKQYAANVSAATHERVGLIEVDGTEMRLSSFAAGEEAIDAADALEPSESFDAREMTEALEEMNWDVDRWLVVVLNPRIPEARALLRDVGQWVLLSTCDHDGVVCSYRLLKGLAESYRPRLSLALLDGADSEEIERIHRKLAGVCGQFLNWDLAREPAVTRRTDITETLVLCCRPTRDKGQIAAAPQWTIVGNFLQSVRASIATAASARSQNNQEELDPMDNRQETSESASATAEMLSPAPAISRPQAPRATAGLRLAGTQPAGPQLARDTAIDVVDLPVDAGPEAILTAILQQNQGELVECPVRAPMCDGARLAISRDRRLVLLAVCRAGLSDLRTVGQAYRWIAENRVLIAMAVPQFAVDTRSTPALRLIVDHADVAADVLQPILQADHVSVQAYRKVRWGGRTGLFLEAA